MYKCPKCGSEGYFDVYVNDPVWEADHNGIIQRQFVYLPDVSDTWECTDCGHKAYGFDFLVKDEE